jgi:hypothetical protein
MRSLKEEMTKKMNELSKQVKKEYTRYQLYTLNNGKKSQSVGKAYLRDETNVFTVRLWMFLNEKYYLLQDKENPKNYVIMTRELNKNPMNKKKYFWSYAGLATYNPEEDALELSFDLLEKKIFLSLTPENPLRNHFVLTAADIEF